MAEIVRMPRLSDTMTEGTVAKWHKKVGDAVSEGDLLAEIETDKATMEFESFQEGVLLHIGVEESSTAPVDCILAILGKEGEDVNALIEADQSTLSKDDLKEDPKEDRKEEAKKTPKPQVEKQEVSAPKIVKEAPLSATPVAHVSSNNTRVKASPLAKKLAKEKGVDVSMIQGTGEEEE